jgi:hypothetical protein
VTSATWPMPDWPPGRSRNLVPWGWTVQLGATVIETTPVAEEQKERGRRLQGSLRRGKAQRSLRALDHLLHRQRQRPFPDCGQGPGP